MSFTRGGQNKRKRFEWHFDPVTRQLIIINQNGRGLIYGLDEIHRVLVALHQRFSSDYFPLSNNVEFLSNGTEKPGLGQTIQDQLPEDVNRSQGGSYLGVVMEEAGYFEWNGKAVGICWRLIETEFSEDNLAARLSIS